MNSYYRILDNLEAEVKENNLRLEEGYDHYWRYFREDKLESKPSYIIGSFNDFIWPNKYKCKNNICFFKNGFCLPKERYAVYCDGERVEEYTNYANRATNFWLQILLLNKDISFIHGAGAFINNKGIIFPADGGVGKTTLMSGIKNFTSHVFLGDDFVMIGKKGKVYAYPSDFSVYKYHLSVLSEIKNTKYSREIWRRNFLRPFYLVKRIINFGFKKIIGRDIVGGGAALYAKVPAKLFFKDNNIGGEGDLKISIWLERYEGKNIKIEKMSRDEQVKNIEEVLRKEFGRGIDYMKYIELDDESNKVNFSIRQKKIIEEALNNKRLYKILIPKDMEASVYRKTALLIIDNLIKEYE